MCDPFKRILLMVAMLIAPLPAASLRWVHLGTIDARLVDLEIDGKVAYRKMPPGRCTPWAAIPAGLHRFRISSGKNPGTAFEMEITGNRKITVVSVSDDNGNLHSRTFGLEEPQGSIFFLNMMPGTALGIPETKRKSMFGKGFWLPGGKAMHTVAVADGEGFSGEIGFSLAGETPTGPYLAVLSGDDEGKPKLAILRDCDALFEMGDKAVNIPGELEAAIRIISGRRTPPPGAFDPYSVDWEKVDSRIFWLNLAIGREPCRLEIKGFPALRRMPSGRGSGFLKWPAGNWAADVVAERTNEKLSGGNFPLAPKASIGLISSGGGKYPHRLLTLEGRSRDGSKAATKPRIRFVNALPDGTLGVAIREQPEPVRITLEPGDAGNPPPLGKGGFPGATLDLTIGAEKRRPIGKIPAMPAMPPGDWVVVVHLDKESFASPALTWVEMDKGAITFPATPGGDD